VEPLLRQVLAQAAPVGLFIQGLLEDFKGEVGHKPSLMQGSIRMRKKKLGSLTSLYLVCAEEEEWKGKGSSRGD
jgi:hypothetical protein